MKKNRAFGRRLNLEPLEERCLLAVLLVDDDFTSNDATAGKFTTIQAAVTAATVGDKIKVRPGTYAENVVITKQLKIEGAHASLDNAHDDSEASIVDPVDNDTNNPAIAFDIQADGVEIEGFTISELDDDTDEDGTIGIRTSADHSGYRIEDNVIENHSIGIYVNTATSTTPDAITESEIQYNVIRDNDLDGDNSGNGIFSDQGLQNVEFKRNHFSGSNDETSIRIIGGTSDEDNDTTQTDIRIRRNSFEELSGAGIYFENVVNAVVTRNTLHDIALSGIQLNGGNQEVTIKHNKLVDPGTSNLWGIILSDTEEIDPNENNLIRHNHITGAGLTGIAIQDSSNNTIRRNHVEGSLGGQLLFATQGNGISLENADNNVLERNLIENNARNGIFLDGNSTGNTLTRNKSKGQGALGKDYHDSTSGGTGPSNTRNTYVKNKGITENVTGLIAIHLSS